jgi:glycosyltransferase involved in cell wall biosynthesis
LECIVLGTVAATLTRVPAIVNAVAGLGSNFTGLSVRAHLLRSLLGAALKMAFNRSRVIFQNPDDFEALHRIGLLRGTHAHVIRGSGVDTARFLPSPKPYAAGRGTVLLASRLLWAKGIGDFVQAARLVQARLSGLRFVVAGVADSGSPGSIPERQIAAWREEGTVEFLGHCDEMSLLLGNVDLVVLPTYYGEGVPRILLEAAASGLATVATDMPGCREITRHGHSGLLVPPRDPVRLAEAVEELMLDPDRRARMGARGRELVCAEFSEAQVNEATLKVYVAAMGDSRRRRKAGR